MKGRGMENGGEGELDRITPRNAGIILKILLILSDIPGAAKAGPDLKENSLGGTKQE